MADILLGTRRKVSIATEAALGTKATTGFRSAILQTEGLLHNSEEISDPGILGDMPFDATVIPGSKSVGGSIGDNTLYSEGAFPLALLHAMGSVSSAQQGGTSAYKHDYTFVQKTSYGDTKGLTIKVDRDSSNAFDFYGCAVNSLTIKWAKNQVISWMAEILGINRETGSSPTVTKPTINPFVSYQAAVTIAGTAIPISDGTITIKNNFSNEFYDGQTLSRFPRNGFAEITGSFTKPVVETSDETDFFNKFLAKTTATLDVSIIGDLISGSYYHKLNIACPRIIFKEMAGFGSGSKENPKLPISFKALGNTDGTMPLTAYIINTETSVA